MSSVGVGAVKRFVVSGIIRREGVVFENAPIGIQLLGLLEKVFTEAIVSVGGNTQGAPFYLGGREWRAVDLETGGISFDETHLVGVNSLFGQARLIDPGRNFF